MLIDEAGSLEGGSRRQIGCRSHLAAYSSYEKSKVFRFHVDQQYEN